MNFLDMGFGEILLVIVVAIIIWGPGKIPEIARNLGKLMNNLRKTSFDLTTQIRKEIEEAEKESDSSKEIGKTAGTEKQDTGDTGIQGNTDKQEQ